MIAELHNLPLLLLRPSTSESGASAEHAAPLNIALLQTSNATAEHWLCSNADVAALPDLLPDSSAVGVVDTSIRAFITALEICMKACILRNVKVGMPVYTNAYSPHQYSDFEHLLWILNTRHLVMNFNALLLSDIPECRSNRCHLSGFLQLSCPKPGAVTCS